MSIWSWLKDHIWCNGGVGEPIAAPVKKTREEARKQSEKQEEDKK